jgi:hypothetical protein
MRMRATHLGVGQLTPTVDPNGPCGGLTGNTLQACINSNQIEGVITPVYRLSPTLPTDYDPSTGTVAPTNTTGQTTDVSQATLNANAALETTCEAAGGTWDATMGCTAATAATDWTPVWIAGGIAAVALLMIFMKK